MDNPARMKHLRLPAWLSPAPDSVVGEAIRRGKSPWADTVHALWSAWVFITPMFGPAGYTPRWIALTLVSYPLFLLLFALSLLAPARTASRYALGLIALCLALLPWYPSGMSYFVFGCVMLRTRRTRSLVRHALLLLALNIAFVSYALWLGYPWQMMVWMPLVTLIIGIVVHVDRISQDKDAALKLSHDEVRRLAALAERERIGRDLHDLLGHTLSLVALKSELAGKLLQRDPTAARREIDEVSRVARDALSQVRSAVSGIRATGLVAELASAKLLLQSDSVALRCHRADIALSAVHEAAFALTLREAVTNIQRHARARQVEISFDIEGDEVVLRVDDDGRGGNLVPGNGLTGMRERIEALGGRLRIDSASPRGTRIEVRVPVIFPASRTPKEITSPVISANAGPGFISAKPSIQ